MNVKIIILLTMNMTPPFTLMVKIQQKYLEICLVLLKSYLHGLLTIK